MVWLGHVLNMSDHRLYITEERIKRLENFTDSFMYQIRGNNSGIIKVGALGQVISLQSVLELQFEMVGSRDRGNKCTGGKLGWG